VSLKRAGFRNPRSAIAWTDIAGSKVSASLFRASLTMFLSVVRVRLIYSPILQMAWAVAPAGSVGLQKVARAPAASTRTEKMRRKKLRSTRPTFTVFQLRFSFTPR